ncbi:sigma-70 family RNA polymerase sigma factor [Bauldia sp.]|uniref:sigma-70 family RNA polymerase sigma factor n=1 Tax=Bauldia sp. TaxID=2575872 RepID=UPI003BAB7241
MNVTKAASQASAETLNACIRSVAASQDRAAFEVLFRHFAPRVKSYLLTSDGGAAAAEELMQETMVTVWRKAGQFDSSKASASTWVFTIARNLRIDAYRRERRPELDPNDPALVPAADPQPDRVVEGQQAADKIKVAMADLSPAEQAILRLAYFEDKPQSVIAKQLGIPLGTVKSRLRLAFGKLRAALAPSLGDVK